MGAGLHTNCVSIGAGLHTNCVSNVSMGAGHHTSCVSMGAGHLCNVNIITLATLSPTPIRPSLASAATVATIFFSKIELFHCSLLFFQLEIILSRC